MDSFFISLWIYNTVQYCSFPDQTYYISNMYLCIEENSLPKDVKRKQKLWEVYNVNRLFHFLQFWIIKFIQQWVLPKLSLDMVGQEVTLSGLRNAPLRSESIPRSSTPRLRSTSSFWTWSVYMYFLHLFFLS